MSGKRRCAVVCTCIPSMYLNNAPGRAWKPGDKLQLIKRYMNCPLSVSVLLLCVTTCASERCRTAHERGSRSSAAVLSSRPADEPAWSRTLLRSAPV